MSLTIGPGTKIGALLKAYPEVEDVLISMAPAFGKLRNPVVRRTVAKVATLEDAASIGGIGLREMIQRISQRIGQSGPELPAAPEPHGTYEDASWLASGQVVEEVSADRMLERGEHPIRRIRESVAALEPGQALLLHSSFRPEPLMETMRRAGVAVHCVAEGPVYVTYFGHKRAVT